MWATYKTGFGLSSANSDFSPFKKLFHMPHADFKTPLNNVKYSFWFILDIVFKEVCASWVNELSYGLMNLISKSFKVRKMWNCKLPIGVLLALCHCHIVNLSSALSSSLIIKGDILQRTRIFVYVPDNKKGKNKVLRN